MNWVNPPARLPDNVTHATLFSSTYDHEIGYNIYLPPAYGEGDRAYPVSYHLHGWTGNESSDIWTLRQLYSARQAITVFPNSSPVIESTENLPLESMFIDELLPYIDTHYRTGADRASRSVSGFSMGGGMAMYCAVRHPELFSSVTAYAGTYHHFYHQGYRGVGAAPDSAAALYGEMLREHRDLEEDNILCAIRQNLTAIRGKVDISFCVGSLDVLYCDSEILHLYLESVGVPHRFQVFPGVDHDLAGLLR